jgi:ABC-2 type transport system permease protein
MAYILGSVFLFVTGYIFWIVLEVLNSPSAPPVSSAFKIFFGGIIFFWIIKLFLIPCLTMRSIAEEKSSGTIETLLTVPVSDFQIVIAKYLSALFIYSMLWSLTFSYVLIINSYNKIDMGPIFSGYLGTILIGAYFISVGLFTSCLTKNQIISALLAFAVLTVIFSIGLFEYVISDNLTSRVLSYINMWKQMQNFSKGLIDSRAVIYYLSSTVFFLFLSIRVLETRNWR